MNGAGANMNIFISYFLWPGRMFVAPVLASLLCFDPAVLCHVPGLNVVWLSLTVWYSLHFRFRNLHVEILISTTKIPPTIVSGPEKI